MDKFQSYILNSTSECWKCNAGYFYMYFSSSDMIYPINCLHGFVLLCFVVVMSSVFSGLTWCIYPYLAGLLLWPWGLICFPQYQKKQPWRIWAKWTITKHNKTWEIRYLFTHFWWYTVNVSASAQFLIHSKTKCNKMWRCEPYEYFLGYIVNVLSCQEGTSHDDSVLLVVSKQSLTLLPNFAERKKYVLWRHSHPYSVLFCPWLLPLGLCRSLYESSSVCMTLMFQVWIMVALSSIWVPGAKRYARSHHTNIFVIKVVNSSLSGPRWLWLCSQ